MKVFSYAAALSGGTLWEKLLSWYHHSVIRELFVYYEEQVFSVNPGIYQHFSISDQTGAMIRTVIVGLMFGVIAAALISTYLKAVHGGFIRTLLREGCDSPQTAKTLYELGWFRNLSIRNQFTRGGAFGKLVCAVGSDGEAVPEKPDFSTLLVYIPEDLRYRAEFRYRRKGSGILPTVLTILLSVIAAALLCRFLPQILGLADIILGIFS